MFNSKIVLGGAQLGNKYGIFSKGTKMKNRNELKKIFKLSIKNKLNFVDTAHDYRNSEKIIGKLSKNKFKIISKINIPSRLSSKNLELYIYRKVNISLKKLKSKNIDILLLHNFDKFFYNDNYLLKIYKVFMKLKSDKIITKLGISSYYPEKIHKFYKYFKFEVVQIPFNIFDQRLLSSIFYNSSSFKNVEIHARSIFLQGILLEKKYPSYFNKWKEKIEIFSRYIKKNNINPIYFCLNFVMNTKKVKKIVIGVQSCKQLKMIIKNTQKKITYNRNIYKRFTINDQKLIIPTYWK